MHTFKIKWYCIKKYKALNYLHFTHSPELHTLLMNVGCPDIHECHMSIAWYYMTFSATLPDQLCQNLL